MAFVAFMLILTTSEASKKKITNKYENDFEFVDNYEVISA
jgi:hypothetical protein